MILVPFEKINRKIGSSLSEIIETNCDSKIIYLLLRTYVKDIVYCHNELKIIVSSVASYLKTFVVYYERIIVSEIFTCLVAA